MKGGTETSVNLKWMIVEVFNLFFVESSLESIQFVASSDLPNNNQQWHIKVWSSNKNSDQNRLKNSFELTQQASMVVMIWFKVEKIHLSWQ